MIKIPEILVVDDTLQNLQVVGSILVQSNFDVVFATNANEALEAINMSVPDLILLDINMPDIDGFTLCKKIKLIKELKDIPIIFISARNQYEDIIKGFEVGGIDYISKPFNEKELLLRIKTHLDLKFAKDELVEESLFKNRLLSIIGHDLRGIFVNISGFTDILNKQTDKSNNQVNLIIDHIAKNSSQGAQLLENLVNWAKVQSNRFLLNIKKQNLATSLKPTIQLIEFNAIKKNISISTNIPENIELEFDEIALNTIIRNLVSNSIKFTNKNGEIKIQAHKTDTYLQIDIIDNGVGMSEQQTKKLFDPSINPSTLGTHKEKGTGLGLIICNELVKKLSGEIKVKSRLNQGTTFSILFKI